MPATKTRRRRRTTTKDVPLNAGDSWQVLGPDGEVLRELKYGEGASLSVAINLAHRHMPAAETLELKLRLKARYGDPDDLFRIEREQDGSVNVYRL